MRASLVGRLTLPAVALLLGVGGVDAQRRSPVALLEGGAAQRVDSARALRTARQAQAAFERLRFRHLPWTHASGAAAGRCDEYIGRFCIRHIEDEEDPWRPPPEPAPVKEGRERLVAELAEAAAAFPGEPWVAGQRVRYLVEGGRAADAVRAARECRGERWWCLALEGYALHAAGEYPASEAAFHAAVEAMPPSERREWTDLAPVLSDTEARALARLPPPARDSLAARLWWLADPFWMWPGNDRKTEHFARLVSDRFQERARVTEGMSWAADLREILLRYGEPVGWERIRPAAAHETRVSVTTHYAPESYEFLPTLRETRDPLRMRPGDWKLHDLRGRTSYQPDSAKSVGELPHQVAVFRRGDSAVVVAGFELRHDSLPAAPELDAALVLARDERTPPVVARAHISGARAALWATAAPESALVSLEVRERATLRAARARYGVDLRRGAPGTLGLSDVLLLADDAARPASLEQAAPLARGSTRFKPGERLGLFWEVYGLEGGADTVTLSVALSRKPVGGLRRAAERLGLARTTTPARMRWSEAAGPAAVLPRTVALAIPDVPPGDYAIELTVRTRAGASASTTREITVEDGRKRE